jgi:CubicO group peptidase (beta-lactamase class C family)
MCMSISALAGRFAVATLVLASFPGASSADAALDARIEAIVPDLEAEIARGMKEFGVPGLAIGIVSGDRLVYGKGFGVGRKGGASVGTGTVFQIGSTTKGFLATTLAIGVDRGLFAWDDRVVDRYPGFQLKDPWVTQEFRLFDLLAQRSGLPAYANDFVGLLGADQPTMIRSLRAVEPVTSFRSSFAYTNITHMLAGKIVADAFGADAWESVARTEILEPLGMSHTSFTAEAIEAAPDTTIGYLYDPAGPVEVPFTPIFPYGFAGAGAINSTVEDLVPWVRLQLGNGTIDGKELLSAQNLAVTKTARVGISDKAAYAMGWVLSSTANGQIVWHNGGTTAYGAFIGTAAEHDVGVVVLTNLTNVGMPDAIGLWTLDRLLGNPETDYLAKALENARAGVFVAPTAPVTPAPPPPLASLAGRFESDALGAGTVAVDGDALTLALEIGSRLRLEPWDGSVFAANLVPEGRFEAVSANLGPGPLGLAEFLIGTDGQRSSFVLTPFDSGPAATFTRR